VVAEAHRGRSTLVLLFLATSLSTLGDGSIHILVAPLLESQGLTQSLIGLVVGAYSVSALVFRVAGGSLLQGTRVAILVPLGSVLSATAFLILPSLSNPLLLASAMALNGLGFALVSTGGLVAVMAAREGHASGPLMGWYSGVISIGYALAGFTGGFVADRVGIGVGIRGLSIIPFATAFVMGLVLRRIPSSQLSPPEQPIGISRSENRYRQLSPLVWLAFFVTVHINLLAGVLSTFFPLYGLAIGLTLTRIGALQGVHSAAASIIRFLTPLLFRVIAPRRLQPSLAVLGGIAVALLALVVDYRLLLLCWMMLGLTRGILRVSSSALMMDASDGRDRGTASGIYLAGLDVGRIIGPLLGGASIQFLGYRGTFLAAGLVTPVIFLFMDRYLSAQARKRTGTDRPGPSSLG
jgi:MFS family permease